MEPNVQNFRLAAIKLRTANLVTTPAESSDFTTISDLSLTTRVLAGFGKGFHPNWCVPTNGEPQHLLCQGSFRHS